MAKYVVRRLFQAIPTLFGITLLSYLIMTAAPGNPIEIMLFGPNVTQETRARLRAQYGVDDPWLVQYIHWMIGDDWRVRDTDGDGEGDFRGTRKGILRGDFGRSFSNGSRPVTSIIGEKIVATLELTTSALVMGVTLGIPVGIIAAVARGGIFDNVTRVLAVLFNAVPNFWLGLILILVFSSYFDLFPLSGRCPTPTPQEILEFGGDVPCPPLWRRLEHLVLPTITLGTVYLAGYSRYMRTSMLDVISQDYIRTARSKGLNSRMIWLKHGARNALIPIATFLGPAITGLLSGAVLTERIFSWPGLGREIISAVLSQDYPLVMAAVIISGVTAIFGYILSDILYAVIDPRIRY
jgi:peptide/nickel transport system permease protein